MVGPGVAIEPDPGEVTVVSPIDGTVVKILPHAFVVLASSGVGVLVHLGINTVRLDGAGFEVLGRQGATVRAGDPDGALGPLGHRGREHLDPGAGRRHGPAQGLGAGRRPPAPLSWPANRSSTSPPERALPDGVCLSLSLAGDSVAVRIEVVGIEAGDVHGPGRRQRPLGLLGCQANDRQPSSGCPARYVVDPRHLVPVIDHSARSSYVGWFRGSAVDGLAPQPPIAVDCSGPDADPGGGAVAVVGAVAQVPGLHPVAPPRQRALGTERRDAAAVGQADDGAAARRP